MYRNRKYRKVSEFEQSLRSQNVNENDDKIPSQSSDEVLPASQPLTQRKYISQRSCLLQQSQILADVTRRPAKSYYESVLIKCGVDLDDPECIILNCDQIVFVNKFRQTLKSAEDYPINVQRFLTDFRQVIRNETIFTKLLSGFKMTVTNLETPKLSQHCILEIFLIMDFMQLDLLEILFEKMKTYVMTNGTANDYPYLEVLLKIVTHTSNGKFICDKVFNLLELGTPSARQDIIKYLDGVTDLINHDEFIKKIMTLMTNEELFTEAGLETLGKFCLSTSIQTELRHKIINYIKDGASVQLLPSFTNLILRFTLNETDLLPGLVADFRDCLKWDNESVTREIRSNQLKVFKCISNYLMVSKKLYDVWLKSILQVSTKTLKQIDFLILLMLISINEEKTNFIELNIRRRVKSRQITIKLFEETIHKFSAVVIQYFHVILELIDKFFRDKDQMVVNFARRGYKICFGIENCEKKILLSKLVGYVCVKSIVSDKFTNTSNDIAMNALMLLTDIYKKYPQEVQCHSGLFLKIFDFELTLNQYRLVIDLLCSMAYPAPPLHELQELQEHIDMLVRKQIFSSVNSIKKIGIIGLVSLIDHIIRKPENDLVSDTSVMDITFESTTDLPNDVCKKAAEYIELVYAATSGNSDTLALFYDEFSLVLSKKNKRNKNFVCDKYFIVWLCDHLTQNLQTNFICDELPSITNLNLDFPIEYKYCINATEENSTANTECDLIGINITVPAIKSNTMARTSIIVFPSLFNVVRNLHFVRYQGSLDAINALLGCAIVVPSFFATDEDVDLFGEYSDLKVKKMLDIYYHVVNWIRETISAFSSQNLIMLRHKLLSRLSLLIRLEDKIRVLLKLVPDNYVPPICHFNVNTTLNSSNKFKKPASKRTSNKKNSKSATNDTTIIESSENITALANLDSQDGPQNNTSTTSKKTNKTKQKIVSDRKIVHGFSYGPKEIYRCMDPDIMLMLKEEFIINCPLSEKFIGNKIGLLELRFILEDLVFKLESVICPKSLEQQQIQYIIQPVDLIYDLVKFIPNIWKCLNQLTDYLQRIIDAQNNVDIIPDLYNDEVNYAKICFGFSIRLFAILYSWEDFEEKAHQKLLKDSLLLISTDFPTSSNNNNEMSVSEIVIHILNNLKKYENAICDLKSAVYFYDFTKSLTQLSDTNNSLDFVENLCYKLLTKTWFNFDGLPEIGTECNLSLDSILRGLFINVKFTKINKMLNWIISESVGFNEKNGTLKTFPCISKNNFPLLFRAICAALLKLIEEKINVRGPASALLLVWENGTDYLNLLLDIVKKVDISRISSIFLKYSNMYLKVFIQQGMPMIETCLSKNAERASELLKKLQITTRFVHNICCHSKSIKNTAIIGQIPFLRETVENLIYRVKAALAANKVSSVFWMGNLRNKDIHGEEILSQVSSLRTNDGDGGEDVGDDDDELTDDENYLENQQMQTTTDDTISTTVRASKSNTSSNSSRSKCY